MEEMRGLPTVRMFPYDDLVRTSTIEEHQRTVCTVRTEQTMLTSLPFPRGDLNLGHGAPVCNASFFRMLLARSTSATKFVYFESKYDESSSRGAPSRTVLRM